MQILYSFILLVETNIVFNSAHNVSLPHADVPTCDSSIGNELLVVDTYSDGSDQTIGHSVVNLCYNESYLNIEIISYEQIFYPSTIYDQCNDPVYLIDVVEVFIALGEQDPHCYLEVDISPYDGTFEASIYNPNLNHTGIEGTLLDCESTGIAHEALIVDPKEWFVSISIPWDVVNDISNCHPRLHSAPVSSSIQSNEDTAAIAVSPKKITAGQIYRANFYRVNELVPTSQCNISTCEYIAWSATYQSPPAFHEPTYFGSLVLV